MIEATVAPTIGTRPCAIRSLGGQAKGPGSLAGLHQARQEHLSQFFTGDDLARLMWSIAVDGPSRGTIAV